MTSLITLAITRAAAGVQINRSREPAVHLHGWARSIRMSMCVRRPNPPLIVP